MAAFTAAAPHTLEIAARSRGTWAQALHGNIFFLAMLLGCLIINSSQFALLLPLKCLPFPWAARAYAEGIRYSKGAFARLLVLMCQWFAPTSLLISFEAEGPGRVSQQDVERIVERDAAGQVVALHLPQQTVLISNHQTYGDWWYDWCLTYYMGTHKDVFIVLKKSLKWIPLLGWGMQFFNFIFLARSWASDRLHLSASLAWLGRRSQQEDTPLTLILYPEGTFTSKDTRPRSKNYADKLGIPDMQHAILPRSTGLHYSLRSLAPRIPGLQMIDITMAYPGIPPFAYGQSYYTLRSIFRDGVPPPAIHMHIRLFDVARDVPIGDISAGNPKALPHRSAEPPMEIEIPENERETFDLWLRALWREKDVLLQKFLDTGAFVDHAEAQARIPLRLRHKHEILDAFCLFMPVAIACAWLKLR